MSSPLILEAGLFDVLAHVFCSLLCWPSHDTLSPPRKPNAFSYQSVRKICSLLTMYLKIVQFFVSLCVKTGSGLLVDLTWEKLKSSSKVEWCFTVSYQSSTKTCRFWSKCLKIVQCLFSFYFKTGFSLLVDLTWFFKNLGLKMKRCFAVSYQSVIKLCSFLRMYLKIGQFHVFLCVKTGFGLPVDLTWNLRKL